MADESKEAKDLGFSFKNVTEAINRFKEPWEALKKEVESGTTAFNKLSSTGNSFNNDIIGMKVAAANTRMTFDEFGAVIVKSGKDFSGLGGSVAKGGQVFTEFSKTFFDSGLTENLRQMGYSSKDLNEVLALQIGFQKSSTDTSVAGQIATAKAAADLASEMDMVAKLTGVSRKEQEAALEKAKVDGQVEAKMRLIGLTQGAEAEKAARDNYAKQLVQAQAMGTDAIFKEMFATGTVRSRDASIQMGILGEAARETANSAKALSKGQIAAAESSMEQAKVGNMNNQKNAAYLQIAAAGVGDVGKAAIKNIETNDVAYQGMVKTQKAAEAMGIQLNNTAEILKVQRQAIQDEQKARHGLTQTIITTQARGQDLNAAIANKIVDPLNKGEIDKAARKLSERFDGGVKAMDDTNKTVNEYRRGLVNQARMGGPDSAPASSRERIESTVPKDAVKGMDKLGAAAVKTFEAGVVKAYTFTAEVLNVAKYNNELEKRNSGTVGETGQAFEPADVIAKIHKGETVLTQEQMKNLLTGTKSESVATAMTEMSKAMPKIDIGSLTRNMPVSTSSTTSSTTERSGSSTFEMPSMDQISFGPDGMPRISAKPQAQAMANSVAAEREAQSQPPQGAENTAENQGNTGNQAGSESQSSAATGTQSSTLDDVVKELNHLNITMAQLAKLTGDTNSLVERQVKATKSMSGNIFGAQ